jgi:CBS domain containing-hemolysin-like protein
MGYFICIVLLWWIAIAERAFVTATPAHLDTLRQSTDASAKRATLLLQRLRSSMSALLLARLALQIGIVVFATSALMHTTVGQDILLQWGMPFFLYRPLVFLFIIVCSAFAFWIVGKADAYFEFPPVSPFLLRRMSNFVSFWKGIFRPFLAKEPPVPEAVVAAEQAPASTSAPDTPLSEGKREIELLRSIVKFGDVTVKKIMQPRAKMVALDFRSNYGEVLEMVRTSGFSRLPVFDDDLDNITGILYVKDLVGYLAKEADFEWQALMHTDVLLVPESKPASK